MWGLFSVFSQDKSAQNQLNHAGNTPLTSRLRSRPWRIFNLSLASWFFAQSVILPAHGQEIIVDPSAPRQHQPSLGLSGNGTPLIDITTPEAGVSLNQFNKLNASNGLIFNNSAVGGNSQIGGNIPANANLFSSGSANVIVNEINGSTDSNLSGTIEIFGGKADLIFANENGVHCSGCNFVNAGTATLTSGDVSVDSGQIDLGVSKGTVRVHGDGISGADNINLVGRHVIVDGRISTDGQTILSGGTQDFDLLASTAQGAPVLTSRQGPYAVDVTSNGLVETGSLFVFGNEVGLDINQTGNLNVTGNASIDSQGNVILNEYTVGGDLTVAATGDVRQREAASSVGGDLDIAGRSLTIDENATVGAGGEVKISAADFVNIFGEVSGASVTVEAENALQNLGRVVSDTQLSIVAGEILNEQKSNSEFDVTDVAWLARYRPWVDWYLSTHETGWYSDYLRDLMSRVDENGLTLAEASAQIELSDLDGVVTGHDVDVTATTGDIINDGVFDASGSLILRALNGSIENTNLIQGVDSVRLIAEVDISNIAGTIKSNGLVGLSAGNDIIIYGENLGAEIDESYEGSRYATEWFTTESISFAVQSYIQGSDIELNAGNDIAVKAAVFDGENSVSLNAGGDISLDAINHGHVVQTTVRDWGKRHYWVRRWKRVRVRRWWRWRWRWRKVWERRSYWTYQDSQTQTSKNNILGNTFSGDTISIIAGGDVAANEGETILDSANTTIVAQNGDIHVENGASLEASGNLNLQAGNNIDLASSTDHPDYYIDDEGRSILHRALVTSGGDLYLNAGGDFHNYGGTINANGDLIADVAGDIINQTMDIQLDTSDAALIARYRPWIDWYISSNQTGWYADSLRDLLAQTDDDGLTMAERSDLVDRTNQDGVISAGGALVLRSANGSITNANLLKGTDSVQLIAGQDIVNQAGTIQSDGSVSLDAGGDIVLTGANLGTDREQTEGGEEQGRQWFADEYTVLAVQSFIQGSDIDLNAGNNIALTDAAFDGADGIELTAGGDIDFDALGHGQVKKTKLRDWEQRDYWVRTWKRVRVRRWWRWRWRWRKVWVRRTTWAYKDNYVYDSNFNRLGNSFSGANVTIVAGGDVDANNGATVFDALTATVASTNGNINVTDGASVASTGDLSVQAAGDVNVASSANTMRYSDAQINDLIKKAFGDAELAKVNKAVAQQSNLELVDSMGLLPRNKDGTAPNYSTSVAYHNIFNRSALIAGGDLYVNAGGDLSNRGSSFTASGNLVASAGGNILNEAFNVHFQLTSENGCEGNACGRNAGIGFETAEMLAGRGLIMSAGDSILNRGGEIGAAGSALLHAANDIENTALHDQYRSVDIYKRKKFLWFTISKTVKQENTAVIKSGVIQTEFGDIILNADNGDITNYGSILSSGGDLELNAGNDIVFTAHSEEVHNLSQKSGFSGFLTYSSNKVSWNNFSTALSAVEAQNIYANAANDVRGIGANLLAAGDIELAAGNDLAFDAKQNHRYLTERGWSFGLTASGFNLLGEIANGNGLEGAFQAYLDENPIIGAVHSLAVAENGWDVVNGSLATLYGISNLGTAWKNEGSKAGGVSLGTAFAEQFIPSDIKTIQQLATACGNGATFQSCAGAMGIGFRFDAWTSKKNWTESYVSRVIAGEDLVLSAGRDITLAGGTIASAGNNAYLFADDDINLTALADNQSTSSSNWGFGFGLTQTGFTLSANASGSGSNATYYSNASLTAGDTIDIYAAQDARFLGAVVKGDNIYMDIGRDLIVASKQNASSNHHWGFNAGITVSGGAVTGINFGASGGEGDRLYTDTPTWIEANNELDIYVGRTTYLMGAVLASNNDGLRLDTGDFIFDHFADHDTQFGGSIGINLDLQNPTNWDGTLSANYRDKQAITYATVSGGTVQVRNRVDQDLSTLNTDLGTVHEVTRDVYIDIKIPGLNLQRLAQGLQDFGDTLDAATAELPDNVAAAGKSAVNAYRRMILNGIPQEVARQRASDPSFMNMATLMDAAIQEYGSFENVPTELMALLASYEASFNIDPATGRVSLAIDCDVASSRCRFEGDKEGFEEWLMDFEENPVLLELRQRAENGDTLWLGNSVSTNQMSFFAHDLDTFVACSLLFDPVGFARKYHSDDPFYVAVRHGLSSDRTPSSAMAQNYYIGEVVERFVAEINDGNVPPAQAEQILDVMQVNYIHNKQTEAMTTILKTAYQLTPIADAQDMIVAAKNGDVLGVLVAGIGFVPVGKAIKLGKLGKKADDASAVLPDDIKKLSEANITNTGKTVLGPYPGYVDKAVARNASYFDIGDAWEGLTDAQRWLANKNFLDKISKNGDVVLFSSTKQQIERAGNFWSLKEIDYLTKEKGYVWVNQWSLRPGE